LAVVLAAFSTSRIIFIQQIGGGPAIAVVTDVALVRGLPVLTTMRLLGRWNWWALAPLCAIVRRIGLSETSVSARDAAPQPAAAVAETTERASSGDTYPHVAVSLRTGHRRRGGMRRRPGMATQTPSERGTLIGQGRTAEVYAWGEHGALKLYHAGWPAAWVEHEAQVTRLVAEAGVPAPAVHQVIEVDGRSGILFERIIGPSLLQQVGGKPWTLGRAVRTFTDLQLAMHAHAIPNLPSQREHLVHQIRETSPLPDRIRTAALRQLDQLPDGDALCHGDYHPDNVLMTRRGPIIIDWGSASRGHPLADVAQTTLLLQIGEPPDSGLSRWLLASGRAIVYRAYRHRYLRRRPAPEEELAAWRLPIAVARLAEGIPGERSPLLRLIDRLVRAPVGT
jgi:uncharacterized protein (TIGR02172 family)